MTASVYIATYSATDLSKAVGRVFDHAAQGAVQITRRNERFVLMREDHLARLLEAARTGHRRDLAELLSGYDAAKIKSLTRSFVDDGATGKKLL